MVFTTEAIGFSKDAVFFSALGALVPPAILFQVSPERRQQQDKDEDKRVKSKGKTNATATEYFA